MKWMMILGTVLIALLIGLIYLGPYRFFIVVSGSMEPEILTGSLILVDQANSEPVTGDVITFQHGDTVVTHRVVQTTPEGYETKGDANKRKDDGIVSRGQVIGTCVGSIPYLGYVCSWFRTRTGKILICLLAVEWMLVKTLFYRCRQKTISAEESISAK